MKPNRAAFTLFELILAIALAAVLLSLIGMAISLYLTRVETDRSRVEEAQLARSVLAMITDDIRAASIYHAQDTKAIALLMAAGTPFDVDSIDKARATSSGVSTPGGVTSAKKVAALTSSGAAGASSSQAASSGSSNEEPDQTMPLGISGRTDELYVDVTRLPKPEELFATVTGYTNAPSPVATDAASSGTATASGAMPPADLKTVHYYVRQGEAIEPGSAAATSLAPEAQASAGGLVRQEIPRQIRVFAEQSGGSDSLDSGGALIAPEVVSIGFKYFNGAEATDTWDMKENKTLPIAIEVCVWLKSDRAAANDGSSNTADLASSARPYRQTVFLPMSQVSVSTAAGGADSSTDSTTTDSSSSSSSSGTGSAFDQP